MKIGGFRCYAYVDKRGLGIGGGRLMMVCRSVKHMYRGTKDTVHWLWSKHVLEFSASREFLCLSFSENSTMSSIAFSNIWHRLEWSAFDRAHGLLNPNINLSLCVCGSRHKQRRDNFEYLHIKMVVTCWIGWCVVLGVVVFWGLCISS